MKIRPEQIEAFEQIRLPEFEDRMVRHLKRFSPLHAEVLGEPGLRKMIHAGIERAGAYGLTHRGPAQFYIELLFILGIDFDSDPQYPWAAATLADAKAGDQLARADRLHAQVMDYLYRAAGPGRAYAKQALLKARKLPLEGPPLSSRTYDDQVLARVRELHPERYDYVGEGALRALVARARREAKRYAVASDAGVALLFALMFTLGHGVINDPKYAFVASTLNNDKIADADKRVERLYSKTMTYLDHALKSAR